MFGKGLLPILGSGKSSLSGKIYQVSILFCTKEKALSFPTVRLKYAINDLSLNIVQPIKKAL